MNAIAGGGSFVTFPALVFVGVPSINANVTSTVALFPGSFASAWAYRREFNASEGLSVRALLPVSLAGGLAGALLLLFTPVRTFDAVVRGCCCSAPWRSRSDGRRARLCAGWSGSARRRCWSRNSCCRSTAVISAAPSG